MDERIMHLALTKFFHYLRDENSSRTGIPLGVIMKNKKIFTQLPRSIIWTDEDYVTSWRNFFSTITKRWIVFIVDDKDFQSLLWNLSWNVQSILWHTATYLSNVGSFHNVYPVICVACCSYGGTWPNQGSD